MEDLERSSAVRTRQRGWTPPPPRRRPTGLGNAPGEPRFAAWPLAPEAGAGQGLAPARVEVQSLEASAADKLSHKNGVAAPADGFILSLAWKRLPAAAAFRFADHIWLLFDAPLPAGTAAAIERTTGRRGVTQMDSGAGTLLKIAAGPELAARLRHEENSWQIDVRPRMALPALAVSFARIGGRDGAPLLRYALPDAGRLHWIEDPDSGERLIVVPSAAGRAWCWTAASRSSRLCKVSRAWFSGRTTRG
jgi:hypothetical protein